MRNTDPIEIDIHARMWDLLESLSLVEGPYYPPDDPSQHKHDHFRSAAMPHPGALEDAASGSRCSIPAGRDAASELSAEGARCG